MSVFDRRNTMYGLILSAALAAASPVPAFAEEPHTFDIQAATADNARTIQDFGIQSGIQILASGDQLRGRKLHDVVGSHTTDRALRILLADTGLTHKYVGDRTVALLKEDNKQPEAADTSPSASEKRLPTTPDNESNEVPGTPTLEEIVVTGSHIRGVVAAGAKLVVIDRQAIEASGHSKLQDIVRDLPQNFGGVTEATGTEVGNSNRGAEIQLRGLGSGTTLTLVNGRRVAEGGGTGQFVDVASIATSAIERIEVLSDGASALYGSDAIGGVVNIVLRKDYEGFETNVRGGTAEGSGANELILSQLWGTTGPRGRVLLGYQFSDRDSLPASARDYAASNGDFTRFGGTDWRTTGGNPGTIIDPVTQLPVAAIPRGQDGTDLTADELLTGERTYFDNVTYSELIPGQTLHSAFATLSYDVAERWALSLDARYGTREVDHPVPQAPRTVTVPASNAFNRMGRSMRVAYDFNQDLGPRQYSGNIDTFSASFGVNGSFADQWELQFSAGYAEETSSWSVTNVLNTAALQPFLSSSDSRIAFNVFGDGSNTGAETIANLKSAASFGGAESSYYVSSSELIANGRLFDLPAGPVKAAVGGSYRKEELDAISLPDNTRYKADRAVSALFAEVAVPLWRGSSTNASVPRGIDLSLAGRYEDYDDFGSTFNPKVGLSWQPFGSVKVRGTWGTSFRAPKLFQMDNAAALIVTSVVDPQSAANQRSVVLAVVNPLPDVQEETATIWTTGVDFSRLFADGLSLSLTYFDIDYKDKLARPPRAEMLANEAQYARFITRNPTRAQIEALCGLANTAGYTLSGDCSQPIAAILNTDLTNLSSLKNRGIDAELNYTLPTGTSRWRFGMFGTYILDYATTVTDGLPSFSPLDTYRNPLSLRLAGTVGWQMREWGAHVAINYSGSYEDSTAANARRVDDWTTVNLTLGYHVDSVSGWLSGSRFSLSLVNLLDERPPFVDIATSLTSTHSTSGYDTANANVLGRQVAVQVTKAW